MATCRHFSWKKVPTYIAAQLLGAIVGSALTYGIYHNAIDLVEGGAGIRTTPGTASLFGTYPVSHNTYPTPRPASGMSYNPCVTCTDPSLRRIGIVRFECIGILRGGQ